jgi:hypothetical protein
MHRTYSEEQGSPQNPSIKEKKKEKGKAILVTGEEGP